MDLEAKILNPISIKIGKDSNVILSDELCNKEYPLIPGAFFANDHFGFIIISDKHGKQKEVFYPTQCRINAIGIEDGILNIFEDGKKDAWKFTKTGNIKHSAYGKFTNEYKRDVDIIAENYDMFMGEPKIENPLRIQISPDPEQCMILQDELVKRDYPLSKGAIIGTIKYGFILVFDTDSGRKEAAYPTQNRIDAVGTEGGTLSIYEKGKYNPWKFSLDGTLKKQASRNRMSAMEANYIQEVYNLNEENRKDRFSLHRKK